jgi:hypothetical protein
MNDAAVPACMTCLKCGEKLAPRRVSFNYLGFPFSTALPACPVCGQAYLSEEFVAGKLLDVEKTLEDK